MARILVVDDSHFARTAVQHLLEKFGHEVVGTAATGEEAVRLVEALRPDLVTMDVVMPGMDGYEATRRIMAAGTRRATPTRVLILSGVSGTGRKETILALCAGAVDFVQKPDAAHFHALAAELEGKVETTLAARPGPAASLPAERPATWQAVSVDARGGGATEAGGTAAMRHVVRMGPRPPAGGYTMVAVGVSTGGPSTLERMLSGLPADFPSPILVAQHMPKGWTETLSEHLDERCALSVREARQGEALAPGSILVAPGDLHFEATPGGRVRVSRAAPVHGFRPSVNLLFRSVAAAAGARALAIVLTGMGDDGLEGSRAIRAAGGTVVAQDEATSVVYGMPRVVAEAGLAQWVAGVDEIGTYLRSLARRGRMSTAETKPPT